MDRWIGLKYVIVEFSGQSLLNIPADPMKHTCTTRIYNEPCLWFLRVSRTLEQKKDKNNTIKLYIIVYSI